MNDSVVHSMSGVGDDLHIDAAWIAFLQCNSTYVLHPFLCPVFATDSLDLFKIEFSIALSERPLLAVFVTNKNAKS